MRHCDRHSVEERDALFVIFGTLERIALGLSCHSQLVQAEPPGIGCYDAGRGAVTAANDLVDGTASNSHRRGDFYCRRGQRNQDQNAYLPRAWRKRYALTGIEPRSSRTRGSLTLSNPKEPLYPAIK